MNENEFLLYDRISKIQSVISKYGEDNFYVSYSGGKDSVALSHLLDLAIPGNKIPRVYANTGIEYKIMLDFIKKVQAEPHPWDLIMLKPKTPIKEMLERDGYPFKSKKHSEFVAIYQKHKTLENRPGLQHYLHRSDDGVNWSPHNSCPKVLEYQFTSENTLKISDKCCVRLKEEPLHEWQEQNGKTISLIGLMREEGGRRHNAQCVVFKRGKIHAFQPLAPLTKAWEDWFIKEYNIELCPLYLPPYNFNRTGCKGCPFAVEVQEVLDTLEKFFPEERKQCEYIWKPVYEEYRRLGYRLREEVTP